ncbi:MAG: glycerol-3-phosphate dehydrogenase/oxidase [Candidatus Aquilonibacter sp.]
MRNFGALDDDFDVVVIGGGASGLGAAVDAISRGYKTALVEAVDFAKATSSRSTKLIHGGVRYLAEGDIHLVREALRERAILRKNAPHLVSDLGFICPAYRWYEAPYYFAGLTAYDLLAGSSNLGRSAYLSPRQTLEHLPALRAQGLRGSIRYHDGQFDDSRLAISLARTAIDRGAVVVNYARVVGFERNGARLAEVRVRDEERSIEVNVRARVVVNATGIFSDELRRLDDPASRPLLSLSRGSHIVVPHEVFPGKDALLVPKTDDGRVLFIIPWHDHVLIGTTDIAEAQPSLDPVPTQEEIDYLLHHAARYLERPISRSQITATYCGLRPLVDGAAASTARLSREHVVETSISGLVTIAGGKWTTYRQMAQDTIDVAGKVGGLAAAPCRTHDLPLNESLLPGTGAKLHPNLAYTEDDVVHAIRYEMARTVDDVLSRRTRASFLDERASAACAPRVAALLASELSA